MTTTTNAQQLETRFVSLFGENSGEVRFIEADGRPNRFLGLIPYGTLSVDLGGFRERITPSAFRSTLSTGRDVRALVNHQPGQLLGRTSNGTLRLQDTPAGLQVEVDLPNTSYANDMRELVRRGDVRGLSFGFKVNGREGQKFTRENGQNVRELLDVGLGEVSIVGNPAYTDSTVALRCAHIDPTVIEEIPRPLSASCRGVLRRICAEG